MLRITHSLEECAAGKVFDLTKPVALIGDGESKIDYIFNRMKITPICVNRAANLYPCCHMVCSRGHFPFLDSVVIPYVQAIIIERTDGLRFPLVNGANAVVFLSFLVHVLKAKEIILQGFNFSRSDQRAYNWENQKKGFMRCAQFAASKGISISKTHDNGYLKFIQTKKPDGYILK